MRSRAPRLARVLAAVYPRHPRGRRRELADFIGAQLADDRAARGWRGLASALRLVLLDLARAWMGRAALPLTTPSRVSASTPRRSPLMDRLAADFRHSLRTLARTPAFTVLAIVLLAIGIGAATAVYAVADGAIFRPFSYPDMDRIVLVTERGRNGQAMSVAWPNFHDWKTNDAFEELGVYRATPATLAGGGTTDRVPASFMSASVFRTMGIPPLEGRVFTDAEDQPGAPRVAIVSERLWRTRFAARDDILGLTIDLNAEPFTVVGVMPAGMRFPGRTTDVWLPLGLFVPTFPPSRGAHPGLTAVGRLKPEVTLDEAQRRMDGIAARLGREYKDSNEGLTAPIASYYELIVQNIRPTFYLLLAAVGLLLGLACSNLASLMLARAEVRQRELAVRAALGASRARLVRQLFVEALLLAVAGGLAGLALAWAGVRGFLTMQPTSVPRIDLITVDWRVALVSLVIAAATAVLFGLLPALRSASPDLQRHLMDLRASAGSRSPRLRRLLVAGQVAIAAILLVGAGLLSRSLSRLLDVELGFNPASVVTMRLSLPPAAYPAPDAWIGFHGRVVDRLTALPGIEAAGLNSALPLAGMGAEAPIIKEGELLPSADREQTMTLFQTTGGEYFRAMRIPLLRGRTFDARDTATSPPVAVVDDTLATRLFGSSDPIGRRVSFEFSRGDEPGHGQAIWREVVGVVQHVRHYGLVTEPPYVQVYAPVTQLPIWFRERRPEMALVARATGDAETAVADVRRVVADLDSRIPLFNVRLMTEHVGSHTEQSRLGAVVLSGFAGLAAFVAAIGLYGVLAYVVSLRTREIGVRLALGASSTRVIRGIVSQGLVLAAMGLAAGLAGAVAGGQLIAAQLYEISPTDGWTFAAVAAGLAVVAIVASFVPARRAASVDPLVALRQ
jgi:putative ABC transport system permease protein